MRRDDFDPEEFEYEDDQENIKSEYKFKKGNTLDYYNEDLSRKAVGRLFEDKDDSGGIVKGYRDEPDDEPRQPEQDAPVLIPEPDAGSGGKSKDFVKGYVKVTPQRSPQKTTSAYRPTGKPQSYIKDPPAKSPMAEAEEEETFSLYRKKEKKNEVHARPAVKVNRNQQPEPEKKPAAKEPDEQDKKPDNEDYDDFRERYKNREYIPSPSQPRGVKKTAAEGTNPGEYYEEYVEEPGGVTGLKMALAVLCFVFLVILAVLVFQINSAKAQLQEAQAAQTDVTEFERELQMYKIENEDLQNTITSLKEQLEALSSGPQEQTTEASDDEGAQSPESGGQSAAAEENTYIVQSGDSLSKISKRFYDTESEYGRIKEANNLQGDSISPGQVLIIPPLT